jgi:hypothetical protein
MINYYRASVRQSQKEAAAKLRPISAPTLVIWGERDSYLGFGQECSREPQLLIAAIAALARSAISSGETSSTCVAIDHRWPNGSVTEP